MHATAYDAQVQGALKSIELSRQAARQAQDVVRLTCLNDKFIQVKAEANVFDLQREQFGVALDNSDDIAIVRASYVKLRASGEHAEELNSDAQSCLGVVDLSAGASTQMNHDEFPDDPTVGDPFPPEIEPPAYASPFR